MSSTTAGAPSAEALASLRRKFAASRGQKVAEVLMLFARAGDPASDFAALKDLRSALHKLAGSSAMFGCPRTGDVAREGERLLDDALTEAAPRFPPNLASIVARLAATLEEEGRLVEGPERAAAAPAHAALGTDADHVIAPQRLRGVAVVVASSKSRLEWFEREITAAGYTTKVVSEEPEISSASAGADVVLIDVQAQGDGYAICRRLSELRNPPRARILFSDGMTAFDALKASTSKADRMIHRASDLRGILRPIGAASDSLGARILSVEDDPDCGRAIETVLAAAGHSVKVLARPDELFGQLSEFRPELLLLDYDLPSMNGFEIARVVRSDARHESTPIIFVTTHSDKRDRRAATSAGGDDFVTKPFTPDELLEIVHAHLHRYRELRRRVDSDPLTELLNRAASVTAIEDLLVSASRRNSSALVAILDLDHFKRVNDELGHPTGDRVLREMGVHLRTRMRPGDVAGRLGGEEMVVAMEGTSIDELVLRLDEIRQSLRIDLRSSDGAVGRLTFSAGAAMFPRDGKLAGELLHQADLALYAAKSQGRNRVVVASILPPSA